MEHRTIIEIHELRVRYGALTAMDGLVALGSPAELIDRHAPDDGAARRAPNLEDFFLALTGRELFEAV